MILYFGPGWIIQYPLSLVNTPMPCNVREKHEVCDTKARGVSGLRATAWWRPGRKLPKNKNVGRHGYPVHGYMVTGQKRPWERRVLASSGLPFGDRALFPSRTIQTPTVRTVFPLEAIGNKIDIVARSPCLIFNIFM